MPYLIDAADARWGHRMGHFPLVDAMYRDGFTCSLCGMVMGETAELLAREYGISREASDAFALAQPGEGGTRDRRGRVRGRNRACRVPKPKRGRETLTADEHPRATTAEGLAKLARRYSSSMASPASSRQARRRASPTAARGDPGERRCGRTATTSRRSRACWDGPVRALIRGGWGSAPCRRFSGFSRSCRCALEDFDLVELNEAFAPQVLAVLRDLPIAERAPERPWRRHCARTSDRLPRARASSSR